MSADATTEWTLGMGGWWRRERGAVLRVRTRSLPPRDEDAVWTCEVDLRPVEGDAPFLTNHNSKTAPAARRWCDAWAMVMIHALRST